jgi:hypothetical protein
MRTSRFLVASAAIEATTGLALVIAPATVVALLIGTSVDELGGLVVARVVGVALFSIGVACWFARNESGDAARGLLLALLVYNVAITLLLVQAAVWSNLRAVGLWPAVALHAGFSVWGVISRPR